MPGVAVTRQQAAAAPDTQARAYREMGTRAQVTPLAQQWRSIKEPTTRQQGSTPLATQARQLGAFRDTRDQRLPIRYLMEGTDSTLALVSWVADLPDLTAAQYTGGNLPLTAVRVLKRFSLAQ